MKREIKFRAWDSDMRVMHSPFTLSEIGEIRRNGGGIGAVAMNYSWDELLWLQFTGLKDKNGREIYEGDIVLYGNDTDPNPVIFDNQMFCVPVGTGVHKTHLHIMGGENKWEVIGNIYENPELLSK